MPEPKDDKNYDDLKKDPPEFPAEEGQGTPPTGEGTPPAGEGTPPAEGGDEGGEGKKGKEGEEKTPVWAENFSKRLDQIEENIKASKPPAPPTPPAPGEEFQPNFEKGQFVDPKYKPKSYNEFTKKLLDLVGRQRQHQTQVQTEQEEGWNKEWDRQFEVLTTEGKLPPIKDPNDPKDPGKLARAKLLLDAATAKSPDLIAFYNVTAKYKKGTPKAPPSSQAPVGGETGGEGGSKPTRAYAETKKPISQVMAEKYSDLVSS